MAIKQYHPAHQDPQYHAKGKSMYKDNPYKNSEPMSSVEGTVKQSPSGNGTMWTPKDKVSNPKTSSHKQKQYPTSVEGKKDTWGGNNPETGMDTYKQKPKIPSGGGGMSKNPKETW
jgi:hypothetical protein